MRNPMHWSNIGADFSWCKRCGGTVSVPNLEWQIARATDWPRLHLRVPLRAENLLRVQRSRRGRGKSWDFSWLLPPILENYELRSLEQAQVALNEHLLALAPRITDVELHYTAGDSQDWLVDFLRAADVLESCTLVAERHCFRDITAVLRGCHATLRRCSHITLSGYLVETNELQRLLLSREPSQRARTFVFEDMRLRGDWVQPRSVPLRGHLRVVDTQSGLPSNWGKWFTIAEALNTWDVKLDGNWDSSCRVALETVLARGRVGRVTCAIESELIEISVKMDDGEVHITSRRYVFNSWPLDDKRIFDHNWLLPWVDSLFIEFMVLDRIREPPELPRLQTLWVSFPGGDGRDIGDDPQPRVGAPTQPVRAQGLRCPNLREVFWAKSRFHPEQLVPFNVTARQLLNALVPEADMPVVISDDLRYEAKARHWFW